MSEIQTGGNAEHPAYPPHVGRWNVIVSSDGVVGCVGAYRWRWLARLRAQSSERYWPNPKTVTIQGPQSGRVGGGDYEG